MRITSITIQNFRKLLECHIDISEQTTLFPLPSIRLNVPERCWTNMDMKQRRLRWMETVFSSISLGWKKQVPTFL